VYFRGRATESSFLNDLSRHRFEKQEASRELQHSHPHPFVRQLKREGTRDNFFSPEAMFPHISLTLDILFHSSRYFFQMQMRGVFGKELLCTAQSLHQ
jgi:hypothetical protein